MNAIFIPARPVAPAASDALIADVRARLAEWHAATDCVPGLPAPGPVPEAGIPRPGEHRPASTTPCGSSTTDHQVYLHPWTGPLYALPEPAFALLVGHEVAYYAVHSLTASGAEGRRVRDQTCRLTPDPAPDHYRNRRSTG